MHPRQDGTDKGIRHIHRVRICYGFLMVVCAIFIVRLFYLQVIRHDYYQTLALAIHRKEYQIPATRGIINAHDGDNIVPLVLNQKLYTLFVDPKYVDDPHKVATKLAAITKGKVSEYEDAINRPTRYAVLAEKLTPEQKKQIDALALKGVGTREESYRIYPEGSLAAQVLGFVNADDKGTYGIEQVLNDELSGTPGKLKAITDVRGVPLVSNQNNIVTQPKPGADVTLTLDISMQQQLETILKRDLKKVHSTSGSAMIMDPYTGAIKAMANYPTYNPAEYYKASDPSVYNNAVVSSPLEVGSVMKTLTTAAALDSGAITKDETFYDPAHYVVDGFTIRDIEEDGGAQTRSVTDILTYSLNTGATWELMQMGGGKINAKARNTWHDYMVNHFQLGKPTGIAQGYEASGHIPSPSDGYALNLKYANTAFGQGMTATPLQMGAALSSVVNGGTYYKPRLLSAVTQPNGSVKQIDPKVEHRNVVSEDVSKALVDMMRIEVDYNVGFHAFSDKYIVGGKTGTAQIADLKNGGYLADEFNGTYIGFVGGDKPQYVIVTRVNKPQLTWGYAGHDAAQPIFVDLTHMLINNGDVTPKH